MRPVLLHGGADLFALRGRQVEIACDLRPAPPGIDTAWHLRAQDCAPQQRQREQAWHLFLPGLIPGTVRGSAGWLWARSFAPWRRDRKIAGRRTEWPGRRTRLYSGAPA